MWVGYIKAFTVLLLLLEIKETIGSLQIQNGQISNWI